MAKKVTHLSSVRGSSGITAKRFNAVKEAALSQLMGNLGSISIGGHNYIPDVEFPEFVPFRLTEILGAAVDSFSSPAYAEANRVVNDPNDPPSADNKTPGGWVEQSLNETTTVVNRNKGFSAPNDAIVLCFPVLGEWLVIMPLDC